MEEAHEPNEVPDHHEDRNPESNPKSNPDRKQGLNPDQNPDQNPHSLLLRHMPSLDSIRGAAVLMVVLFHGFATYAWASLLGPRNGALMQSFVGLGRFGVDVFFVLSGFLITGILMRSRPRPDYYRNFYLRRVLRILPAYLLMLLVLKLSGTVDWRFALAATLFLANFSRLFGAPMEEYGSLWSLAVEEHFYLLWPACVHRFSERWLKRLLLLVLIGEPLLRVAASRVSSHIDIHYKTPFVLDMPAYGAMLALLVWNNRLNLRNARRVGWTITGICALLVLLEIPIGAFHATAWPFDALADLPLTWGTAGVILLGLARDHTRAARTGRTDARGVLAFYGWISYGLYLLNVYVYGLAKNLVVSHYGAAKLNSLPFFATAVAATILIATAIAYLSRRFYEAPFLALKDRWRSRLAPPRQGGPATAA